MPKVAVRILSDGWAQLSVLTPPDRIMLGTAVTFDGEFKAAITLFYNEHQLPYFAHIASAMEGLGDHPEIYLERKTNTVHLLVLFRVRPVPQTLLHRFVPGVILRAIGTSVEKNMVELLVAGESDDIPIAGSDDFFTETDRTGRVLVCMGALVNNAIRMVWTSHTSAIASRIPTTVDIITN